MTAVIAFTCRQMKLSEAAEVASLALQVFDQFVAPNYQPDGVAEFHRYASLESFLERHDSGHLTLVAEDCGQFIGMLHLRKPRHVAMLFVRPAFQRKGVGGGLLAAAGELVGNADCEFTVNASPNAVSAYERLRFQATDAEQCVRGIRFVPMRRQTRG